MMRNWGFISHPLGPLSKDQKITSAGEDVETLEHCALLVQM